MGCSITVELNSENEIISIKGNTCKRGEIYAENEIKHPVRSLTSTVRVNGGLENVVPCKSSKPVPKEVMFNCMKQINSTDVDAPVSLGDVLIKDILGTGSDIIATNNCNAK